MLACAPACSDDGAATATTETDPEESLQTAASSAPEPPASSAMPDAAAGDTDAVDAAVPSDLPCEATDPLVADGDADDLFGYPHVPKFDLYLPAEEWEALQQNARDEEYVSARACFEGRYIGTIGMRFKGYYGSLFGCFDEQDQLICPRLSMKLKFNEYVDDQRFYGLKRLNFNAYRHDDSRLKERLAYDLYRSMGVVAPRASWAVLRVNGESLGLYGMVEQLDGRFTKDRWPDAPDGNLYKEIWPTQTDPAAVAAGLATNEEIGDVSAFVAFAEALTSAPESELSTTLGSYMDVEYLARYMAVDDAVASYDGVTYFWTDGVTNGNHNFYIYEQSAEKYTLIPWDVESTFWINPDHAAPHWTVLPDDCSETYPYWEGLASAPACDPFFRALNQNIDLWRTASRELLDGPFALDTMLENIDRHAAFIAEEAHADPTPAMYATFDSAVENLRTTVPQLRERLEALIAE